MPKRKPNRYAQIIDLIFDTHFTPKSIQVDFTKRELNDAADAIGVERVDNPAVLVYYFSFRHALPDSIASKAPEGHEWIIRGAGKGRYALVAIPQQVRIRPRDGLITTKVPDATPEIIRASALGDEQALLALVRYNRLLDIFLGLTTYSLQNHLRTTVVGIGQVEVDELYVGLDRFGVQYILPVQAKGGTDEIGITQIEQDLGVCAEKWPHMSARSIAVQFMADDKVAMFELGLQDEQLTVIREAHYRLVPFAEITDEDRALYLRARDA